MKALILCLAFAFPAYASQAQYYNYNQGGTPAKNYYEQIPYEWLNGKLFVYVNIGGGRHKFVFDTGAPLCVSKALADAVNLPVIHMDTLNDAYGGHVVKPTVIVDKLELGSLVFEHVPAVEAIVTQYACWNVDGSIGSNMLRGSIVYIDPVKQVIILTDQLDKLPVDTSKGIPLVTKYDNQTTPYLRIWFDKGSSAEMEFDTGDASFIRFNQRYMDLMKRASVFKTIRKGYGSQFYGMAGAENSITKYLLRFPIATIGAASFQNITTGTVNGGTPAIGSKLLDYGAVALDYIHGRFYFNASKPVNDLSEKQWPFIPTLENDHIVVGVVWDNAPASLKPGQQILAVNDISCERLSACDVLNRKLDFSNGTDFANLTIRDSQGVVKTLVIHKEPGYQNVIKKTARVGRFSMISLYRVDAQVFYSVISRFWIGVSKGGPGHWTLMVRTLDRVRMDIGLKTRTFGL
jgi:hypothetical protein